jgi:DNA polymerase-3 subunit epsilon
MVRGQQIDEIVLSSTMGGVDLIVAHNAKFDRAFLDARLPQLSEGKVWGCSMEDIPWKAEGIKGRALDYLLFRVCSIDLHGHMADIDTAAGLHLLKSQLPVSGRRASEYLLEAVYQPRIRLEALNSVFEKKDILKMRGYRWDPSKRVWWTELSENGHDMELAWLTEHIYDGRQPNLPIIPISPTDRYRQ